MSALQQMVSLLTLNSVSEITTVPVLLEIYISLPLEIILQE